MTLVRTQVLIGAALASVRAFTSAHAQQKTPGYNHKIPDKIMTPDKVETRIGTSTSPTGGPPTRASSARTRSRSSTTPR